MTGAYEVIVKNRRVQYKFTVSRNITILKGDSATGKTTMIDMIAAYQRDGAQSGINLSCKKPCVVLSGTYWHAILPEIRDSIVFIDEGEQFVQSVEFARAVRDSDNYYVIATRSSLFNLTYSTKEVYGIRNKAGNRYQGTKKLYSEFYPLHNDHINSIERPDVVIVEDSNSGYEFFSDICRKHGVPCFSACGNGNVYSCLRDIEAQTVLVVVDGAAFGQQMERILSLRRLKNVILYLPESFEWIILKSGLIDAVENILKNPADYINSAQYYTWEQFFTRLLVQNTQDTYLRYTKAELNPVYLQTHEQEKIMSVIPTIKWEE